MRTQPMLTIPIAFVFVLLSSISMAAHLNGGRDTLRNFIGAVYAPPKGANASLGVGWVRMPFYWTGENPWISVEPQRGVWDWTASDNFVRQVRERKMQVLPILCYTASWAAATSGKSMVPPKNERDWEDYVEHVVSRYSHAPFDLKYFQVWNEPTIQAGFWQGETNLDFIDQIYLPAAKIIRKHHCKVVFGGWPCSNSMQELSRELEWHDAWKYTDIIDIHYDPLTDWQYLYDRWIKTGKCEGLWQTEIGFVSFPNYLPNFYIRALHWALNHHWRRQNQYKLFWYASWGAGSDGEKCLTQNGSDGNPVLSPHGTRLSVINSVFGKAPLSDWKGYRIIPPLPPLIDEEQPASFGFMSGQSSYIIAMILDKPTLDAHSRIQIEIPMNHSPANMELELCDGSRILRRNIGSNPAVESSESDLDAYYAKKKLHISIRKDFFKLEEARYYGHAWNASIGYLVVMK